MVQLIFKDDIGQNKLEALIQFLKSWDIDAELKNTSKIASKKKEKFSLNTVIWNDNPIDAKELRKQTWNKSK